MASYNKINESFNKKFKTLLEKPEREDFSRMNPFIDSEYFFNSNFFNHTSCDTPILKANFKKCFNYLKEHFDEYSDYDNKDGIAYYLCKILFNDDYYTSENFDITYPALAVAEYFLDFLNPDDDYDESFNKKFIKDFNKNNLKEDLVYKKSPIEDYVKVIRRYYKGNLKAFLDDLFIDKQYPMFEDDELYDMAVSIGEILEDELNNMDDFLKEGYGTYTVGQLRELLENALYNIEDYEDSDEVKLQPNTYGLSSYISVPSKGFVDLYDIMSENEDY